jgi:hypothetical protein
LHQLQYTMKKYLVFGLLLLLSAFKPYRAEKAYDDAIHPDTVSDVFFTNDISGDGVLKVFKMIESGVKGNVAIKVPDFDNAPP